MKRFRRIYPIYWIVLLVWLCLYLGLVESPDPSAFRVTNLLSNVLLIHLGNFNSILGVSWTLFHEILFYAVFALTIVHRRLGIAVLAVWMATGFVCFTLQASPWMTDYLFSPLHLLFGYGIVVMVLLKRERLPLPWLWFLSGTAVFAACIVAGAWHGIQTIWLTQLTGLSVAVLLLGMMHLERTGKLRIHAALTSLGDASYSIYLVHLPVIRIVSKPLFNLASAHHIGIPGCAAVLFASGRAVGFVCHIAVERPVLHWMGGF